MIIAMVLWNSYVIVWSSETETDMTRSKPTSYRGFSIEQERDGTFSLYCFGYVAGNFKTLEEAKKNADWRRE